MSEWKTLHGQSLLHGTVIAGTQNTHVKGDRVHGNSSGLQPCLVCDHQVGVHIPEWHVLSIHEPHEAVECGAVGLDEPYLPQTFQTVDNLPHENKKEKTAMIAVKSGGHVIGGESTSLTSQSCDDILQPVGILGNLLVQ